jgi:hypothetical protein
MIGSQNHATIPRPSPDGYVGHEASPELLVWSVRIPFAASGTQRLTDVPTLFKRCLDFTMDV